ncbi:hypothetical protein NEOLI_001903 [Neolecta irregularis DAH-3]|uniref:Uncharacterized protein n=1 Tax=Neolecta irregularis (strain DAH-3) TaxID=1198029 RepID=A0A1U7LPS9_NEOID|nr:hypothetical protein NEOLI_001903 [Neolecta irregularis DAH-3]|eukprot:OLL24680.1 hypothetical protein NEOLI_001903 [Neolecta irregularis DAH-3]
MKSFGSQHKRRRAPRDSAASTITENDIVQKKTRGRKARVISLDEDEDDELPRKTRSSLNAPERRSSRRISGRNATKTIENFTSGSKKGAKNTQSTRISNSHPEVTTSKSPPPIFEKAEISLLPIHEFTETEDQAESVGLGPGVSQKKSTIKDLIPEHPEMLPVASPPKAVSKSSFKGSLKEILSVSNSGKIDSISTESDKQDSDLPESQFSDALHNSEEFSNSAIVVTNESSSSPDDHLSWNPVDPVTLFEIPDLIPQELLFTESELDMAVSRYIMYTGEKEVEAVSLKFDKMIEKLRNYGDAAVAGLEGLGR